MPKSFAVPNTDGEPSARFIASALNSFVYFRHLFVCYSLTNRCPFFWGKTTCHRSFVQSHAFSTERVLILYTILDN